MAKSLKKQESSLSKLLTSLSNFALSRPKWLAFLSALHGCGVAVPPAQDEVPAADLTAYFMTQIKPEHKAALDESFKEICERYFTYDEYGQDFTLASFYTSISDAEGKRDSFVSYPEPMGYPSIGLWSLSYEDSKTCPGIFDREADKSRPKELKDIHRTDKQVECTLSLHTMLLTQSEDFPRLVEMAKDDAKAKGDARKLSVRQKLSAYWSVLRLDRDGYQRFKQARKKYMPRTCLE